MSVKCYIKSNSNKLMKIGSVEISCSEMMADYLDSQTDENNWINPKLFKDEKFGTGYHEDWNVRDEIVEICNKTMDIGDRIIADEFSTYDSFFFERKDYDFSYVKTVEKVEDRMVYMRANSGRLFAIPMNDWLYMNDKPKVKDRVEVTKFLSGKSAVTNIIKRYASPSDKTKRICLGGN
ncbi:MAG: hypothetical protein IJF83_10865 [Methanobrevibacter sp.]|nr:hypothetical protein [Methanobrevibacter sp.]